MIADANVPQALAGVMGGHATAMHEACERVCLEAAHFDSCSMAQMGRRHRVHTDAQMRFERGVDPALASEAMGRAWQLICAYAEVKPITLGMRSSIEATPSHVLTRKKLARTLGWVIEDAQVVEILKRLRAKVESTDEGWRITPPSDRCDWAMHADSIEEILRLSDRSQCPEVWPVVRMQPSASTHVSASNAMADYFAARGFAECVNYSFIDPKISAFFALHGRFDAE